MTTEQLYQLRLECLQLALERCVKPGSLNNVVSDARQMFDFISGGAHTTAMSPPPSQDDEIPF